MLYYISLKNQYNHKISQAKKLTQNAPNNLL